MKKGDLETRAKKSVLKIDKKITDIKNLLHDLNMKLCHIIKDKRNYNNMMRGNDYFK